jgi:hypothetical protein
MLERPAAFLEPLSRFVLEVLPWGLSGLIVLYLMWGVWSGPDATSASVRPLAAQSTSVVDTAL